jgi:predicted DNA-binding antitoxin AbrB/MazE fold protein
MTPLVVEATYEDGVLKPKQPLGLAEGSNVRLSISAAPSAVEEPFDPLADVIGICTGGPPDGADNHDKYIYGDLHR